MVFASTESSGLQKINNSIHDLENLKQVILKDVPENIREFESILGEPLYINGFKPIKFLKKIFQNDEKT